MPKLCIRGQITPKRRPVLRWLGARVLAAALVLVASVATVVRWYERSRSHQSLGKLADLRITDLASTTPVDVVSSDRHTVKPWFQGKLPFTFDLREHRHTGDQKSLPVRSSAPSALSPLRKALPSGVSMSVKRGGIHTIGERTTAVEIPAFCRQVLHCFKSQVSGS